MTRAEQEKFIHDLTNLLRNTTLAMIQEGRLPAEWNGIELREFIADLAHGERVQMDLSRKREYKNIISVLNTL